MASTGQDDQDASKDGSMDQSTAAGQEASPPEEKSTPGGEQVTQKKRGKKRRRGDKGGKEGKQKNSAPTDSPVERPSRERKSVVRYAATAPRRLSASKAVNVQQGSGEKLKDIPNVSFKFSKRKSDESLRVLHKILFGRKTNVHFLKRNILQFSGFVWSQNEEKERSKLTEKLNKCNKDRLLEYCDLLDIYTLKVTTKKEEISAKLVEFLECPRATREVILSAKDTKRKKGRRGVKGTGERLLEEASHDRENKRLKKGEKFEAKKDLEKTAKAEKDIGKSGSIGADLLYEDKKDDTDETREYSYSEPEDEVSADEDPESTKLLSDGEEMDVQEEPKLKEKSPPVRKVSDAKSKLAQSSTSTKKASRKIKQETKNKAKRRVFQSQSERIKGNTGSLKVKKDKATIKKDSKDNSIRKVSRRKGEPGSGSGLSSKSKKSKEKGKINVGITLADRKENKKKVAKTASKDMKEKKQIAKAKSKIAVKMKGKHKDVLVGPTREKLHAVACEILKEVDFNVATLADIINQLGAHFDTDLMHRKTEIKDILEEVINSMTDDDDDEDAEDGGGDDEDAEEDDGGDDDHGADE